jgi:hypothetical protein
MTGAVASPPIARVGARVGAAACLKIAPSTKTARSARTAASDCRRTCSTAARSARGSPSTCFWSRARAVRESSLSVSASSTALRSDRGTPASASVSRVTKPRPPAASTSRKSGSPQLGVPARRAANSIRLRRSSGMFLQQNTTCIFSDRHHASASRPHPRHDRAGRPRAHRAAFPCHARHNALGAHGAGDSGA